MNSVSTTSGGSELGCKWTTYRKRLTLSQLPLVQPFPAREAGFSGLPNQLGGGSETNSLEAGTFRRAGGIGLDEDEVQVTRTTECLLKWQ